MRIVESRQRTGGSRGILLPWANQGLELVRLEPSADLAPYVERHWILRWDFAPRSHVQRTAGFPCVDLVFEREGARVYGPMTGVLERKFEGSGRLFATKLRPGAWRSLSDLPPRTLVDRSIPLEMAFGVGAPTSLALAELDDEACRVCVEDMLRGRAPRRDPRAELVGRVVDRVLGDSSVTRVKQVEDIFGVRERTLQRMFHEYVGVGIKWLIRWSRLQAAAERLRSTRANAGLALELGYFDQAHFVRDFAEFAGLSPSRYRELKAASHERGSACRETSRRTITADSLRDLNGSEPRWLTQPGFSLARPKQRVRR